MLMPFRNVADMMNAEEEVYGQGACSRSHKHIDAAQGSTSFRVNCASDLMPVPL
jgi:hypothetical protein